MLTVELWFVYDAGERDSAELWRADRGRAGAACRRARVLQGVQPRTNEFQLTGCMRHGLLVLLDQLGNLRLRSG